jgi:hypothetical protein
MWSKGAAVFSLFGLVACAEPSQSVSSDPSRRAAPLPACVQRLPPQKNTAFMRQLTDEQYWKLVFPSYDEQAGVLPDAALTCTGHSPFKQPAFQGSEPSSAPLRPKTGDLVFGGGANRIKVVWLKTHLRPDGDAVGVLAIVRTVGDYAEMYAAGAYRGNPKQSRFGLERMGSELLVTALDDRCTGRAANDPCDTTLVAYLPWSGELKELAQIPLQRIRFATGSEPGASGKLEYTLVTSPSFKPHGIELLEQVSAKDAEGHELRKAEHQRTLAWANDRMSANEDSLWDRVFVPRDTAPPQAAPAGSSKQ